MMMTQDAPTKTDLRASIFEKFQESGIKDKLKVRVGNICMALG